MEKKLYRVREGKILCGVCGGIGEYFNIDPTLIRLAAVLLSCAGFSRVVAYIVAAVIVPEKPLEINS